MVSNWLMLNKHLSLIHVFLWLDMSFISVTESYHTVWIYHSLLICLFSFMLGG